MTRRHSRLHSAVAAVCGAAALSGAAFAATGETAIVVSVGGKRFAAVESDWTDWDALDDEAKSRCRFFKLVAHLTTP